MTGIIGALSASYSQEARVASVNRKKSLLCRALATGPTCRRWSRGGPVRRRAEGDDRSRSPELPCRPRYEGELRVGVSDWSGRVWTDGGRERAVKGSVELPGVG